MRAISGISAAFIAAVAVAFVEVFRALYPSRETWWRMRRLRGRRAARLLRERFEEAARRRLPHWTVAVLVLLAVAWGVVANHFAERWYEIVADLAPYALIGVAVLRIPPALRGAAQRMREYERQAGEDPDAPFDDDEERGGPPDVLRL